ncbi:MAG: extracellular solute-binding protein, partial [Gaiellaceae bacterium]
MRVRVVMAAALAVAFAVVATTAGASTGRAQANKLTVWLQVDAQSGWPDVVAAANQEFQQQNPGWSVNVQYQSWGDHLQKFDATIAGNDTPDVIEMGNTEMTAYMSSGAFADLTTSKSQFPNSGSWLAGLAKSGMYGG